MLLAERRYFRQCAVDVLLGVLLRPCAFTVLVADVHDVPVVGHLPGACDAAVLGDDVAAEYDQRRLRGGTCRVQGLLPPFPSLLDDVGVLGVLVGIEVVDEQHVGTYGLIPGATRRLSGAYGAERHPRLGDELVLRPCPKRLLLAVVSLDASVCLKVRPVRREQPDGVVLAVGCEQHILLLSRQRQERDDEHRNS